MGSGVGEEILVIKSKLQCPLKGDEVDRGDKRRDWMKNTVEVHREI